ncbi:MAG TPA: protein kinase [Solirubrobacterales bacterium]|nr:protein kinase [Solirubrobacterales bacterium]
MSRGLDEGVELGNGRYILENRLGSGGAATVWLAQDTVLERPVAIKVLSEALASDPGWVARFRREARLAASLTHPNLVSVYDFNADAEPPYLVMEHMPGGSLYDHLQAGEEPDPEQLTQDVLAALSAIHAAGIVHCDIKPGNILLSSDGTACLTDFGVARPEDATSLTQTGHIPGTARYMAPELWQGHPADERSDLYATGVLLRGAVGEDTPPELLTLIDRLAADEPAKRPHSASDALAELVTEVNPPGAAEAVTRPQEPAPRPQEAAPRAEDIPPRAIAVESKSRPHRRVALAGLCVLAVVAAVALAQVVGGGEDREPAQSNGKGGGSNQSAQNGSGGSGGSEGDSGSAPAETTPAEPEAPVDAVALDSEGRSLIDAGDPEAAIPILEQAVESYPENSRDINYAYSLYNLGEALLLAGRPDEAIPYLEKRLEFSDQRETVEQTLAEAQAAAGEGD